MDNNIKETGGDSGDNDNGDDFNYGTEDLKMITMAVIVFYLARCTVNPVSLTVFFKVFSIL